MAEGEFGETGRMRKILCVITAFEGGERAHNLSSGDRRVLEVENKPSQQHAKELEPQSCTHREPNSANKLSFEANLPYKL